MPLSCRVSALINMNCSKNYFICIFLVVFVAGCIEMSYPAQYETSQDTVLKSQRLDMVKSQIEQRGIKDKKILQAMRSVPRHLFVPEGYREYSYADRPLPIGEGQTISQPYIVALMTELIQPGPEGRVLEIGTGSGYQAAVLAEICAEVYTIEIVKPLADSAEKLLKELEYTNINVKCGDGFMGWKEYAPYDGIVVTAAPEEIPEPLIEQLAEGGFMIIPVGPQWRWQELYLITKKDGKIIKKNITAVRFVPMTGEGVESIK
ncbi:protein-L-isoaspartate(D-aspartate) O-methyltransferase [Elusimicrobiota bacterium]